jgi:membrane-bound lytic murein transglycosylase B
MGYKRNIKNHLVVPFTVGLSALLLTMGCSKDNRITNFSSLPPDYNYIRTIGLRNSFSEDEKKSISKLIEKLKADGIERKTINSIFNNEEFGFYYIVPKLFNRNPEKEADAGEKTYEWYRNHHGVEGKIREAKYFMERYMDMLVDAEKRYSVDKRYVVSILGVESDFCKNPGSYKAINSLVTQYVLIDRRRGFAYTQIKEIIEYSNKTGISLFEFSSSYAGAIGCAQFIPSSLNSLFVGKDEKIEKTNPFDIVDSIYSISYYLKKSGWDKSQTGKTPAKDSRNWKAIFAYNHSDNYTKLVIEVAESLSQSSTSEETLA